LGIVLRISCDALGIDARKVFEKFLDQL